MFELPLTCIPATDQKSIFKSSFSDAAFSVATEENRIENFRRTLLSTPVNTEARVTQRAANSAIRFASNGTLTLVGSKANDTASVSITSDNRVKASVTGVASQFFKRSEVKTIRFFGDDGDDRFTNSTNVASVAFGGKGDDRLTGGGGVDKYFGEAGDDTLRGNGGHDRLRSGEGSDSVFGGDGNDVIDGGSDDDVLRGDKGNDEVRGRRGNDELTGADGNDRIFGDSGDDDIDAGNGNNEAYGGTGNDSLKTGSGKDKVGGGLNDDVIDSGAGNDRVVGDAGFDTINGGAGNDNLFGSADDDIVRGGSGNDTIHGNADADLLFGESGVDKIFGDHGDDSLYGGASADTLRGGVGNDGMFGGNSSDTLFGNGGKDRFLVQSGDRARDVQKTDARINFRNDSSRWTEREIEIVDAGLQMLHLRTGNTRLLKDSVPAGELEFFKVSVLPGNLDGRNSLNISTRTVTDSKGNTTVTNTFTRRIEFDDWNENDERFNPGRSSLVAHELGHNWDDPKFELAIGARAAVPLWNSFLARSGWRDTDPASGAFSRSIDGQWWHLNSTDFVFDYGRTNPYEDWSTVWERALDNTIGAGGPGVQQKVNVVNSFFTTISRLN